MVKMITAAVLAVGIVAPTWAFATSTSTATCADTKSCATNANYGQCKKAVAEAQKDSTPTADPVANGTYKNFSTEEQCKAAFTSDPKAQPTTATK